MTDWTCSHCGRGNREKDRQCGLCRKLKPGATAEPARMQKAQVGRRKEKGAKT